jgi:hypothetical protein
MIYVLLLITTALLTVFAGTFALSNSAYAQSSSIYLACAAPPGQNPAPSEGTTLNYAVINNGRVDFTEVIPDNAGGNARGWNPDGTTTIFTVSGVPPFAEATSTSVIAISTNDFSNWNLCGANLVTLQLAGATNATMNITKSTNMTTSQ